MKELVEYIVKSLVSDPAHVEVSQVTAGPELILELRVAPEDMGRVIGRGGRVINSIRSLVYVSAARQARRAQLELVED